jgi:hypothetical protein
VQYRQPNERAGHLAQRDGSALWPPHQHVRGLQRLQQTLPKMSVLQPQLCGIYRLPQLPAAERGSLW